MDKEKFIQYLNDDSILGSESVNEIKSVCNEYPYFQTAHILFIKNIRKLRKSDYFENLKKNIIYISDKEVLYKHINSIDNLLSAENGIKKEVKKEINEPKQSIEDKKVTQDIDIKKKEIKVESELKEKIIDKEYFKVEEDYFELDLSINEQTESEAKRKEVQPDKSNLIDEFINTQPRIVPNQGKPEENIDISEESVVDNEDYMTETLAKVYIKQGYYSKAMFIYEKLSLKYPEKSTYFAAQIEKVKKLSNKL
ncbi:hypothetical protein ACFLTE_00095 [Bacteroidota bacterium]